MSQSQIEYRIGNQLDLDQFIELYVASTLGERRPVHDRIQMKGMLENANLVITAWDNDLLVGVSRSVTDFAYVAYLSDLAVRLSHQRRGIGKMLIQKTREALDPRAMIVLLAAPRATEYYGPVGFQQHGSAWVQKGSDF